VAPAPEPNGRVHSVLRSRIAECEAAFDAALIRIDIAAAARCLLALNEILTGTGGSADDDRRSLHRMVGRLAQASVALAERAELVGPLTDTLVEIRRAARTGRDWEVADSIRDRLLALGLELQDSDAATTWSLRKG
jgi:cysteinyl-tRNA synthetase